MGLFTRRAAAHEPADDALTFMSRSAADRLRTAAREAFAERGLKVTIHPDHMVDATGRQFGLWNIAAQCVDQPERKWHRLIGGHVQRVLDSMAAPSPFDGLEEDEAHYRTYAKLYDAHSVPQLERYPHREFAPGIVELLALDLPDAVATYKHEDAQRFGGFERLRAIGAVNLRQLAVETVETVPAGGGSTFHLLLGDSVYTGSRALLLPRLAEELTGELAGPHGWLMSVPNRHQVTWHVVRDLSVLDVASAMAHFTLLGYTESPGPISPDVYWWNGDSYEQLTQTSADGSIEMWGGPRFHAMLEALAAGSA